TRLRSGHPSSHVDHTLAVPLFRGKLAGCAMSFGCAVSRAGFPWAGARSFRPSQTHSGNMHEENTQTNQREPAAVQQVQIKDIVALKAWQVWMKTDQAAIRRYATVYKSGGEMPPIRLAKVDNTLRLVDGWHRLQARKSMGLGWVEAVVFE